mgnify:CR=1 FL=1
MKLYKLFFFLFFTSTFFAQIQVQKPFIEVTGTSKIEIIPDEIYLNICLKERIENGKKLSIEYLENELKAVLKKIEIPQENLFISDVNAVISKTGWWTEEVFSIGNYTLKINGANKLKLLFENFKELNISEVNITKATHSKIIEIRKKK